MCILSLPVKSLLKFSLYCWEITSKSLFDWNIDYFFEYEKQNLKKITDMISFTAKNPLIDLFLQSVGAGGTMTLLQISLNNILLCSGADEWKSSLSVHTRTNTHALRIFSDFWLHEWRNLDSIEREKNEAERVGGWFGERRAVRDVWTDSAPGRCALWDNSMDGLRQP